MGLFLLRFENDELFETKKIVFIRIGENTKEGRTHMKYENWDLSLFLIFSL